MGVVGGWGPEQREQLHGRHRQPGQGGAAEAGSGDIRAALPALNLPNGSRPSMRSVTLTPPYCIAPYRAAAHLGRELTATPPALAALPGQ